MPELSVVIITFNEEKNLPRCLESVKDIADEIVIVDSFSTDKTREIAEKYGVKFIQHVFEGHIEQKNYAIKQSSFPHILSMDADEELSDRLKESIKEVKENWKYDGYYFNRQTNYCGKWIRHTSWYPARKLRLWDSRKGRWGGINPHDRFILDKGSRSKYLKGDLNHYSYYTIEEHLQQINKFSTILARAYYNTGRRSTYIQILFHPIWRFIKDYLIRAGFLDGLYGLVVSVNSSHEVFLKYVKLRVIYKKEREKERNGICFFNSAGSWGGGERWHCDVSLRLKESGYNVMLMSHPHSKLFEKAGTRIDRKFSVRISNLSFLNPLKIRKLYNLFRRQGVRMIIINLSSDLKVAGIAAKLAGVQSIIYRRGSALPIRNSFLNRFLYRRVVTRIIANSEETKRTILARNPKLVPEEKIRIIYNGLDLEYFDKLPLNGTFEGTEGTIVLGNAGRISREKGHVFLLNLAKRLKEKNYPFKMIIAGEGKLRHKLEKEAISMNLEDEVKFLGFVNDVKSFHHKLDIFILTSLYEGFGYVLVEAMASKKPIVAFDIRSSSEIVRNGESGYLVDIADTNQLFDRVEELIKNKALRKEMGEAGRKIVEEKFTFEISMKKILELIEHELNLS